ncbi:MAG: DUF1893 domain-containing protein [Oscillospiraceae bacterium]|nr:DUF1893 domain-containing protein [Oscillospiraceae bacterium]
MHNDLTNARTLLASGDFTCAVCLGDTAYTTRERGIKPLLAWLDSGTDLTGFSAADRVVGRGAAFLYCLLGVKEVHARVMSRPAAQVLSAHGIAASCDTLTDGIINRRGDGPCPFEAAVLEITDPQLALAAIRAKMHQMTGGI